MGRVAYPYTCARVKCVRTSHKCGMSVYMCARVGARVCVHICVVRVRNSVTPQMISVPLVGMMS